MLTRIRNIVNPALVKLNLVNFKYLLKQSFWSIFGSILSRGAMLISAIILARILGQSEYGELGILRSTVNMFVVFAGFGIGNTTSRYIALNKKSNIREARRIFDVSLIFMIAIASILGFGVLIFSKQLAIISFGNGSLSVELKISALLLFFATLNGAYSGSLAGFQDFKAIARNTFISSLVQASLAVLGGIFFGVVGCLVGYSIGYILLFWLHRIAVNSHFGEVKRIVTLKNINKTDKSFLYSFSLPAALSSFMVTPVFWWCKSYMIRSADFKEMALFDVADQWRIIVLFIPSALIQIVLPALTSDNQNFKKILKFNIRINMLVTIGILIPLFVLSKYILGLYGEEYVNTELYIVLISSAIFSSFSSVVGSAIASLGIMWKGFLFNIFWALYLIGFTFWFIEKGWGALGLAYAVLLSYLVHSLTQFLYLKFYLKQY